MREREREKESSAEVSRQHPASLIADSNGDFGRASAGDRWHHEGRGCLKAVNARHSLLQLLLRSEAWQAPSRAAVSKTPFILITSPPGLVQPCRGLYRSEHRFFALHRRTTKAPLLSLNPKLQLQR